LLHDHQNIGEHRRSVLVARDKEILVNDFLCVVDLISVVADQKVGSLLFRYTLKLDLGRLDFVLLLAQNIFLVFHFLGDGGN